MLLGERVVTQVDNTCAHTQSLSGARGWVWVEGGGLIWGEFMSGKLNMVGVVGN